MKERVIFLFWPIVVFHLLLKASSNPEGDALHMLKINLKDPNNVLQNWDATLPNPCTWFHVTCNEYNSVIGVDLGNQDLSGTLVNLGDLSNLQYLELYNNSITGKIPEELGNLANLVSLDLYMNNISGTIPNTFSKLQKLRFLYQNNPHLKLPKIIPAPPSPSSPASSDSSNTGAIAGGVAAGATLLFAAPAIAFAYWRKRKPRDHFFDVPAEEDPEFHFGHLKRFSVRELLVATDNFNEKNIIGRGGFGCVYKGRLSDGTLVAIKRLEANYIKRIDREFQAEVEMISMAVHRNLLRLRGFCMTSTGRFLVYPYMANGSLASCLQERNDSRPPLEWPVRKNIALGSATGLAYLHDHCDPKIIHCDVKAANILLDEEFEAVVGDFGLAKLMDYKDTHVTVTHICGTIGYLAPEYMLTLKCSEKNDVFGYGVTLLVLITGRMTFNRTLLANYHYHNWVKGLLKDKKLETVVDAELKGNYNVDEVEQLIQVALLCTQESSMKRPKMSEVVRMLEGDGLAEKWEQWQKEERNRQEFNKNDMHPLYANWIEVDSTSHIEPDELSGPR